MFSLLEQLLPGVDVSRSSSGKRLCLRFLSEIVFVESWLPKQNRAVMSMAYDVINMILFTSKVNSNMYTSMFDSISNAFRAKVNRSCSKKTTASTLTSSNRGVTLSAVTLNKGLSTSTA